MGSGTLRVPDGLRKGCSDGGVNPGPRPYRYVERVSGSAVVAIRLCADVNRSLRLEVSSRRVMMDIVLIKEWTPVVDQARIE